MSIHYKFKSSLSYDTVTFDGLHISVRDLKKQILQQKKIGKNTDFDLQITNAQTKETYTNEQELIPKNTSLIVSRIPLTVQQKKQWDRDNNVQNIKAIDDDDDDSGGIMGKAINIAALDLPEEEKIQTMINQSTSEYDPSRYVKMKGSNMVGPVPHTYICHKCNKRGHWIKDCPTNSNNVTDGGTPLDIIRKSTGIPQSFMVAVDGPQVPGARMTASGAFAVPLIDHQVYKEKKVEKPPFLAEKEKPVEATPLPEDLVCGICKDLLLDAVMAPCCGTSFCDECIRGVLVESDEAECPECNEKEVSPDTLIPNRYLRNGVNTFKNQTGYIKKPVHLKGQSPPRPTLPDFVPPGQGIRFDDPMLSSSETLVKEEPPLKSDDKSKEEEKPKPDDADLKPDESTNSLYDLAVEKESKKKEVDKREERDRDRKRRSPSPNRGDSNQISANVRANDNDRDANPKGQENCVYSIQSIVPSVPVAIDIHQQGFFPPGHMPPFMHGEDRSGTPTVDDCFDPYGRMPQPGFQVPPPYDPRYPPPGPVMQMGYRDQPMPPFRGRGRPPHHGPGPGPMHPNDMEDNYNKWMQWMKEKEEQSNRRQDVRNRRSGSRSRSPSAGHRRSYTPKRSRSRSRSRTSRRSLSRRRSHSPRSRSRSNSRPRSRSRSFVLSRSRSPSFSSLVERKISPKKYTSPQRSPFRNERYPEHYSGGGDRGFGWERRGGFRGRGRGRGYNVSPQRQNYSYNRYREEFGVSPPRGFSPQRDRFREQGRERSPRWEEYSRHRRSRSLSKQRTHYEEERVFHRSDSLERRSPARAFRERERSHPREEPSRNRDRRSRERNGRHEKSRGNEKEKRHRSTERSRSRERKYSERARSRSVSRNRSQSSQRSKGNSQRSHSPLKKQARNSAEHYQSPSKTKRREEGVSRRVTVLQVVKSPPATSEPIRAHSQEKKLNVGSPKVSSPAPSDNSKTTKKDRKKDKEKKKRKKEKETVEEREERKRRKREKKEEKRKKLMMAGRNEDAPTPAPEQEHNVSNEQKNNTVVTVKEERIEDLSPSFSNKLITNPSPPVCSEKQIVDTQPEAELQPPTPSDQGLCTPSPINNEEPDDELEMMSSEMLARMPELSRWEIEDGGFNPPTKRSSSSPEIPRVTTEVLKRAENAIFKKAISAIREPKTSLDKQEQERKAQSSSERERSDPVSPKRERSKERRVERPATTEVPKKAEIKKPSNSIQITIPVTTDNDERAVGFAPLGKPSKSPSSRVSVKDRLGSKIEPSTRKVSSPSTRFEEKALAVLSSSVAVHESRRVLLDESQFVPVYEESSDDERRLSKARRSAEVRKRSPETKKRHRSSSESSDESVKKSKKKKTKSKKEKKSKKKKRNVTDSSSSSDSESEKKKHKKSKKKKKRH